MKKLAVTGRPASGKSLVCSLLKQHGAYLVDADEIVHRLYISSTECKQKVVELLGNAVLTNGQLDRRKIAGIVFSDRQKLHALEALIHPMVLSEIQDVYETIQENKAYAFFVVEFPLLFEIGAESFFDVSILVEASEELCIKRFALKGFNEQEYHLRSARFLPASEQRSRADFSINNSGDTAHLTREVKRVLTEIQSANTARNYQENE